MQALRSHPHIYEINLMTWLRELADQEGRSVGLAGIPDRAWRKLKDLGIDLVWLMGMWRRSSHSRAAARAEPGLVEAGRSLLGDFNLSDITGSPYAVQGYMPNPDFGTPKDLEGLKKRLEDLGLRLILDFVPNHTACDHPWTDSHPRRYVMQPCPGDGACPEGFFRRSGVEGAICLAHGKDPHFPPWTDTAQMNHARPETREALAQELLRLSDLCHGLRCDMAMLVLRDVFQNTWSQDLAGAWEGEEFWPAAVARLRSAKRSLLLLAEAYWEKERDLLAMGFDFAYDKAFCDLLFRGDAAGLKQHLQSAAPPQDQRVRFLENHDEPRAAALFGPDRIECALVVHATLPGMRFWQHGQLEGKKLQVPVQLTRAPRECPDERLGTFLARLLSEVNHPVFHEGTWQMCPTRGWPDNDSHRNLLAWCWHAQDAGRMVIANISPSPAQGLVQPPPGWLPREEQMLLLDPLKKERFVRSTAEVEESGLYAGLGPGDYHFFRLEKG